MNSKCLNSKCINSKEYYYLKEIYPHGNKQFMVPNEFQLKIILEIAQRHLIETTMIPFKKSL